MRISDWSSDVCSSDLGWSSVQVWTWTRRILSVQARDSARCISHLPWPRPVISGTSPKNASSHSDRKSVVQGKSESVRVDHGGRRRNKKKKDNNTLESKRINTGRE